ncbi:MAG: hypothetical protein K2X98_00330 [Alphaproteobacteria bacterium]|nr:hypothetical protein [Alphaproteobacteria bacterium]
MRSKPIIIVVSLILVCIVSAVALTENRLRQTLLELIPQDWHYEQLVIEEHDPSLSHSIGLIPDLGLMLIPFQDYLDTDMLQGPCPLEPAMEMRIFNTIKSIGFDNEAGSRSWESIQKTIQSPTDIYAIMKNLRDLLVAHYSFMHENSGLVFGLSGAGDYLAASKVCLCDHIALAHYHIKGGIDERIDDNNADTQTIDATPLQKEVLRLVYRSCTMTTCNAHRFEGAWYTRVAYMPTKEDETRINTLLSIDPHKKDEVICCYKKIDENPEKNVPLEDKE